MSGHELALLFKFSRLLRASVEYRTKHVIRLTSQCHVEKCSNTDRVLVAIPSCRSLWWHRYPERTTPSSPHLGKAWPGPQPEHSHLGQLSHILPSKSLFTFKWTVYASTYVESWQEKRSYIFVSHFHVNGNELEKPLPTEEKDFTLAITTFYWGTVSGIPIWLLLEMSHISYVIPLHMGLVFGLSI